MLFNIETRTEPQLWSQWIILCCWRITNKPYWNERYIHSLHYRSHRIITYIYKQEERGSTELLAQSQMQSTGLRMKTMCCGCICLANVLVDKLRVSLVPFYTRIRGDMWYEKSNTDSAHYMYVHVCILFIYIIALFLFLNT